MKMLVRLASVCLVLICLPGGALAEESSAKAPARDTALANSLCEEGFFLQKKKQTEMALDAYLAALEADPDHVRSLYEIGWSYWVLERWHDVVKTWSRVLELQPDHKKAAKYLPQAQEKFEEAGGFAALAASQLADGEVDGSTLMERDGLSFAPNQDKPFTGRALQWFESGKKKQECDYKDGQLHGRCAEWYESGQQSKEVAFEAGRAHGQTVDWYENGQKKTEAAFQDGRAQGTSIAWHENGQKKLECDYKDSKRQGKLSSWHDNGSKQSEGFFQDGKQHGQFTWWYASSQKKEEAGWESGAQNGQYTAWHENGQKREEGEWSGGKKHGEWLVWHDNGNKQSEGKYEGGIKQGKHTVWNGNGSKKFQGRYKAGEMVKQTCWDSKGHKTSCPKRNPAH